MNARLRRTLVEVERRRTTARRLRLVAPAVRRVILRWRFLYSRPP